MPGFLDSIRALLQGTPSTDMTVQVTAPMPKDGGWPMPAQGRPIYLGAPGKPPTGVHPDPVPFGGVSVGSLNPLDRLIKTAHSYLDDDTQRMRAEAVWRSVSKDFPDLASLASRVVVDPSLYPQRGDAGETLGYTNKSREIHISPHTLEIGNPRENVIHELTHLGQMSNAGDQFETMYNQGEYFDRPSEVQARHVALLGAIHRK